MDTRSKSADTDKKHSRFMNFWLDRKTRAVVFTIACILTAIAYLFGMEISALSDKYSFNIMNNKGFSDDYIESYQFRHDRLNFYEALCITSSFYLRNLDSEGNFDLSNAAFLEYVQKMKNDYGLIIKKDDNGKVYAESDKWDFYVAFGEKYLTNIDYNFKKSKLNVLDMQDKIQSRYQYYSIRTDNTIDTDFESDETAINRVIYDSVMGSINNYSYVEEEYAGGSLPLGISGYDNLGQFIFQYYGDSEISFYDSALKDKKFEKLSDYDIKNKNFDIIHLENGTDNETALQSYDGITFSGYQFNYYSDTDISLFFAPKQSIIDNISGQFFEAQSKYKVVLPCFLACILLIAGCCVYLAIVCGYDSKNKNKWRKTLIFGRWYTDLLILCLVFSLVWFTLYIDMSVSVSSTGEYYIGDINFAPLFRNTSRSNVINYVVMAISFALCGGLSLALLGKFKTRSFIKDSLIYKLIKVIRKFIRKHLINTNLFTLYNQKNMGQKLYTITWIFVAASIAMFLLLFFNFFFGSDYLVISVILFFAYLIYALWFIVNLFKGFSDINKLSDQIEQISKNEPITENIDEYSLAHVDSELLQNISTNITETVEKQVQSERMKIELVTNVSHDLKTPLTSIISYIDLLKNEDLPDEAMDYVKILDSKSQKLKNIVSDVFSIAKATSGIDVEMEEIDGVILLRQVLGDNEDKISASGKTVVTDIACESALINADGNKLYRVFQNLIDNALNYSLDGTRIFVTLKCENGNMMLSVKNTASYEMNFSPDEITERFTRGDQSRTDGGNGLGLSIAKTFTEACGGRFVVELDGDVFKAFVEMPLTRKY